MNQLPDPPKRENYPSRQAYREACRQYEKQQGKAVSMAGRPPMQRLMELEKRVARMNQGTYSAFKQVEADLDKIRKILEANGLTDSPLIIRAKPGDLPPRNPNA